MVLLKTENISSTSYFIESLA